MANIRLATIVLVGICLSGCATLLTPHNQPVSFASVPPGATVKINGKEAGVTPLSTGVERNGDTVAVLEKPGYQDQVILMNSGLNPFFWADVVLLSPIGIIVDLADHATVQYKPDAYNLALKPEQSSASRRHDPNIRDEVSQFIATNYQVLGKELVQRQGPHTDALMDMLGLSVEDRERGRGILYDMYTDISGEPGFTAAVLTRFGL